MCGVHSKRTSPELEDDENKHFEELSLMKNEIVIAMLESVRRISGSSSFNAVMWG